MISNLKNMLRLALKAWKGFTLIEMLVAVSILTTAIAGPLTIASKSLTSAMVAKDQVTAFLLAQDAVEYIRFVRDSNKLKGADWLTGAGGSASGIDLTSCKSSSGCYVDSTEHAPSAPQACGATCDVLQYSTAQGRYTYSTTNTAPTIYTRTVTMTSLFDYEAKLTVVVAWKDTGSNTRSVTVTENIFDWQ